MAEVSIDDVIPRHVEENPYHYTPLEKAERTKAIKDMGKDYPHLPHGWLEMVYDFWKKTPTEDVNDIINKGAWEVPGKFSSSTGGVIHAMEVLDINDEEPLKERYANVKGLDPEI